MRLLHLTWYLALGGIIIASSAFSSNTETCPIHVQNLAVEGQAEHPSNEHYRKEFSEVLYSKMKELAFQNEVPEDALPSETIVEKVFAEMYGNALDYGNERKREKNLKVRIYTEGKKIYVEISDTSGKFFDGLDPENPVNKNNLRIKNDNDSLQAALGESKIPENRTKAGMARSEGGRGIYMAQKSTHGLKYEPNESSDTGKVIGTKVTFYWDLAKLEK